MIDSLPCPFCNQPIPISTYARHYASEGGRVGGRSRSAAKQRASRANGKLGGRPRKSSPEKG